MVAVLTLVLFTGSVAQASFTSLDECNTQLTRSLDQVGLKNIKTIECTLR